MFLTFCRHLCAASSGVVLPALFNTAVGRNGGGREKSQTPSPMLPSLKSFFYLFAAGLLLFPLPVLGLSAYRGDFHTAVGRKEEKEKGAGLQRDRYSVLEGPLLKMPHTDGDEMSRTFLKIRPRSSRPENKIIHNIVCESLNQFNKFLLHDTIEGQMTKMKGVGKRRTTYLYDSRNIKRYWRFNEEAEGKKGIVYHTNINWKCNKATHEERLYDKQ